MLNTTIKTQRFGRGSTILRARGTEPLTLDAIETQAPAVFAASAHESRSARYSFIPTRHVLQGLWNEGFRPFEVRHGGSADETKRGFTKHMVRLRQVSVSGTIVAGDIIHSEVILLNSHDGTSAYQLIAGLFRLVCENGLIAGDEYDAVRIAHKGDVVHEVIEGAYRIAAALPAVVDGSREMARVELSRPEQVAFARAASQLRWEPTTDATGIAAAPIQPEQLLTVRRNADQGADLWRTFNRVQEGLVQGGQRYEQRDAQGLTVARRRVRPVNGIEQNRQLNRALFTLAEEMRRIKAQSLAA